jgi:hypothetical protein
VSTDLTRTSPEAIGSPAPSHSRTGGRFVAGTVLANRYRTSACSASAGCGTLILAAIVALTLAAYIAMGSPKLPRDVKASA